METVNQPMEKIWLVHNRNNEDSEAKVEWTDFNGDFSKNQNWRVETDGEACCKVLIQRQVAELEVFRGGRRRREMEAEELPWRRPEGRSRENYSASRAGAEE